MAPSMFTFFTPPASTVPPAAQAITPLSQLATPLLPVPPAAEAITPLSQPATPLPLLPVPPAAEAITPLSQPATPLPLLPVPPAAEAITPLSTALTPYVAASSIPSIATHAERNSSMTTQKARVHQKQSDAQKATADLRRLAEHEKQDLLATDLGEYMEIQRNGLEELAAKHATNIEHLDKLLNHTPHYRRKVRAINLENAKIHAKGEEVNAGKLQYSLCSIDKRLTSF